VTIGKHKKKPIVDSPERQVLLAECRRRLKMVFAGELDINPFGMFDLIGQQKRSRDEKLEREANG
jgi:hypothetical protein